MHRKISTGGFAELVILLAGLTGITIFSIVQTVPKAKAAQTIARNTITEPTITPTRIPTVTPTPETQHLKAEEAIGVDFTDNLQLNVRINDELKTFSFLGIEKPASDSASCLKEETVETLVKMIKGKNLYLLNYDLNLKADISSRYVFLDNALFLNKYLLTNGLAVTQPINHPYDDEFQQEQESAKKNKTGIWSASCNPTPTPEKEIVIAFITPTSTPASTPTPTITPTRKPSPTKTPTPTKKPSDNIKGETTKQEISPTITLKEYMSSSSSATIAVKSLNPDVIFQLINLHRKTKNLPPFEKDAELCKLAESRAPELYNEIFGTEKVHDGFYKRNIPYWITENMASYGSEEANVNWWLNSTIHRNAIERNYKYSCGACSGNSCTQLFTSYVSK